MSTQILSASCLCTSLSLSHRLQPQRSGQVPGPLITSDPPFTPPHPPQLALILCFLLLWGSSLRPAAPCIPPLAQPRKCWLQKGPEAIRSLPLRLQAGVKSSSQQGGGQAGDPPPPGRQHSQPGPPHEAPGSGNPLGTGVRADPEGPCPPSQHSALACPKLPPGRIHAGSLIFKKTLHQTADDQENLQLSGIVSRSYSMSLTLLICKMETAISSPWGQGLAHKRHYYLSSSF